MLEFLEIHKCVRPPLRPALGWLVQHLDGRRKETMVENHVIPTSGWQVERLIS